jgi:hypothetical protein
MTAEYQIGVRDGEPQITEETYLGSVTTIISGVRVTTPERITAIVKRYPSGRMDRTLRVPRVRTSRTAIPLTEGEREDEP